MKNETGLMSNDLDVLLKVMKLDVEIKYNFFTI